MSKKRRVVYCVSLLAAFGLLGSAWHLLWTPGVYVSVVNTTESVVANVVLAYTGGAICIARLEPGERRGQRINPDGESHLHLTWLDPSGAMQSHRIDVYF